MPSIRDFSGGVLNQELQNLDKGAGVLFDCKNVLSSWNGELRKRTGTKFLKSLEGNSKLIPYRLPDGNDMLMVLRDKVINCYTFDKEGNLVPYMVKTGEVSIPFPTTGWSSNTNGDWTVNSNSTFDYYDAKQPYSAVQDGESYIFDGNNDIKSGNEVWFYFENSSPVVFGSCRFIWQTSNGGSANHYVYRYGIDPVIQYSDDGSTWTSIPTTISQPTVETGSVYHRPFYTSSVRCYYSVSNDSYLDQHRYWRVLFTHNYSRGNYESTPHRAYFKIDNIKFNTASVETELSFSNCPYENDMFESIKWSQNKSVLTMACKGMPPYQVKIESGVFSDGTFTPSDYTNIWTALGYPSCVVYYQNRLWFGGFEAAPTRVYASAFGEFDKFTIPSPIVATSPIMADGTEISNIIENMWGGNNALYCLSEDGISMIDAQGAIVATNQVEFKLRNREPVNSMVPTVKDDIMIYLGRDKRKILITDYDFVVQRFKANCISDNYNDFLQSGIKELHYIPRKSSLIYGVLENGKWFSLLFDIDKGKNAIFPFESAGQIVDVQPIKHGDETKLVILNYLPSLQYVLEEKMPQGDQKIMDFMSQPEQEDYTANVINGEQVYLDHFVVRNMKYPASVIGNLPYLTGQKIEVIADGQYLGEYEVSTRNDPNLYAWKATSDYGEDIIYTDSGTPTTSSVVYDNNGSNLSTYSIQDAQSSYLIVRHPETVLFQGFEYTSGEDTQVLYAFDTSGLIVNVYNEDLVFVGAASKISLTELAYNGNLYTKNSDLDKEGTTPVQTNYYRYSDGDIGITPYYIELDEPASKIVVGYKYDSYAVLKFITPYTERKFPKEIAVNFINTGYLEVGNTFNSLKSVLNNLVESVSINGKRILMNGNYAKTLDKHSFETPYVIVRSDKGLPFIITGMDYKVDMSNYQGGV